MRKGLALLLCLLLLPLHGLAAQGPVYQVFVASFADGDGDGRGDLKGLTDRLPYIQALGVKGLWLMPISPSPSYHKYDVTDYQAIDPAYGTMADFDALVAACQQEGIQLYLDLVLNHTSSLHPWFLAAVDSLKSGASSPYRDYYLFSQEGGHPVADLPGWYYHGSFGPHMPDLNLDNQALREEIVSILGYWLDRGVSGFRLDATTHYYEENTQQNLQFLRWLRQKAQAIQPQVYLVAEAWKDQATIHQLYDSGINSLFDFPMAGPDGWLVRAMRAADGEALARRVVETSQALHARAPGARNALFLSNHDMARSAGMLMMKPQQMRLAAALYLTMPGIPYIYYGEELGMTGSGRDENKRLPMLWRGDGSGNCLPPAGADQQQRLTMGVDMQEQDPQSLLMFYRQLLALRQGYPLFEGGIATPAEAGNPAVAAWQISQDERSIRVLHNLSGQPVGLPAPEGQLGGSWDSGAGKASLADGQLVLPPFSGCIFE